MDRIDEVRAFDHIVLLVAAQAVLRAESGAKPDSANAASASRLCVKIASDRSRMGDQRDPLAFQRRAQFGIGQQPFDAEPSFRTHSIEQQGPHRGGVKIGLARGERG